jgi:hypothetical protein
VATVVAPELNAPHQPRPIRFMRLEHVGDWRLKLYGIALPGRTPREELVDATLRLAPDVFPDDGYHVGFVTVHDSATFGIALYYWWQSANELHQRIYVSPLDDPSALTKLSDPAAGCVWEIEVVDFERRAWLEDVLANPDGPDIERYLGRSFSREL